MKYAYIYNDKSIALTSKLEKEHRAYIKLVVCKAPAKEKCFSYGDVIHCYLKDLK